MNINNEFYHFLSENIDYPLDISDSIVKNFINKYSEYFVPVIKDKFIDKNIVEKHYTAQKIYSGTSQYQHIAVYKSSDNGNILVIDNDLQITEKDEYIYHEMMTHVPLMFLPNAKNILIIGAGDGGICREILKYSNIENIYQIEIDKLVVKTCLKYFPNMAKHMLNKKVKLIFENGATWISNSNLHNYFDLVIMDTTDFNQSDALFNATFFINLKKLMKENSILIFNGDCLNSGLKTIENIVKKQKTNFNFKYCRVYQAYLPMYSDGHYGFIFSSDYIDPLNTIINIQKWNLKNIECTYFTPELLKASFILPKNVNDILYNEIIMQYKEGNFFLPINKKNLGTHLLLDMDGINDKLLNSSIILDKILTHMIQTNNLIILNKNIHKFKPQGVTICYLLTTSHVSIHTWPEYHKCCLDLFTCNPNVNMNKVIKFLLKIFKPKTYKINHIERSI
jgi:spermidine synthase